MCESPGHCVPTLVSDCRILEDEQAFTREVPMDDPNDPYSPDNLSWNWRFGGPKWRPFSGRAGRGPRVPPPPWARNPPKPSKAEREQARRAEVRAERLHLAGLTNAGVIIMGVVLGAMVVVLAFELVSHH
jgi:hypothetical protein